MNSYITRLDDAGCMTITGRDAGKFLQNYLTIDLNTVGKGRRRLAAICNIQGRAVASCSLLPDERPHEREEGGIRLVMQADLLEPVKAFLEKYIIFSRATIDLDTATPIFGLLDENRERLAQFVRERTGLVLPEDERNHLGNETADLLLHAPGRIELILHGKPEGFLEDVALQDPLAWRESRIRAGIPWVEAASSEAFIPQLLNYHEQGGIDFDKGCYLGQEVIARMQYRGAQKRSTLLLETGLAAEARPMQQLVNTVGKRVGQVVNAVGTKGNCLLLAVVMKEAQRENLLLEAEEGGTPLPLRRPETAGA